MDVLVDVIGLGILALLLLGFYFGNEKTQGVCSSILLTLFVLGTIGSIIYSICK